MSSNPMNEFVTIDYSYIEKWNPRNAFMALFSSYTNEKNNDGIGQYNYIDEKDIFEITYLILKHAKGMATPTNEDLVSLATKATVLRISNKETSQVYSVYNGEMPDLHLFYFLDKLFTPYMDRLYDEHGFTHYIVWQIKFLMLFNPSFIFTFDDVRKMIEYSWDKKDIQNMWLDMFTNFIKHFSDVPNLENYDDFQKSISRKPIIKLSDNEYVLCWHWFRNSIILNFHYLLSKDEEYKRHRGDVFEEITASLFKHHLCLSSTYPSVKFNGGEIDILVDTKDTVLLVECKSGILYENYKLGLIDENISKNIESITGKAKEQLMKGKKALLDNKDLRSNGVKLSIDSSKKIVLLNICFEFPVGTTNKEVNDDVVVLSLIDLMMIIDLMEDKILGEPRVKNILDYLELRKRTLGFATDCELTIAISLLYNPHLDSFIDNPALLSSLHLDSHKSIGYINELCSFLLQVKMQQAGKKYELAKENYNGFLRDYILDEYL